MFKLRDYQIAPVKTGVDFFNNSKIGKPSIEVLPTAAGKSIIIAHIAKEVHGKGLVIQPSVELLQQNYDKFIALGGEASIYSASLNTKEFGNLTYATIGSIKNIGAKFKELKYRYIIIDEVHLFPRNADSMLGTFLKESGIERVLGLTATPFKLQTNLSVDGMPY